MVPATITLTASPGKVDQRISFSGQVTSTKGCQAGRHLIVFGDFGLGTDVVTAPDGTFSGTIGAPPFPMASYGVYVDGDATKRKFRGKAIRCRAVGTNTAVVVTN